MSQRRSVIPILGVILYLGIIIGAATDGKPELLIGTIVTFFILCCIYFLRKKWAFKREVPSITEEKIALMAVQQRTSIQLLGFLQIVILTGAAIYGDISVLTTIITMILIIFIFLSLKKKSCEKEAAIKILFSSFIVGIIVVLLKLSSDYLANR